MDDTKEIKKERKTYFYHKSTNKSKSDIKNENRRYSDLEQKESKPKKKKASPLKQLKEIYQDKKKEDNLQEFYKKQSLATLEKKKATKKLKNSFQNHTILALFGNVIVI